MWTDAECFDLKMMRASAHINQFYKKTIAPAGVTAGQYRILRHIDAVDGGSVQAVAEHMGVDRSTLTRTVRPLEKAGLVSDNRTEGCRDRKLVLTDEGKKVMEQARKLWADAQDQIAEKLGKDGMRNLSALLEILGGIE
jgi:DNA-binding MarR family transcriptional regulator